MGVRMAIAADGCAVGDAVWSEMEKRFAGRPTKNQFESLKTWWKKSVERS